MSVKTASAALAAAKAAHKADKTNADLKAAYKAAKKALAAATAKAEAKATKKASKRKAEAAPEEAPTKKVKTSAADPAAALAAAKAAYKADKNNAELKAAYKAAKAAAAKGATDTPAAPAEEAAEETAEEAADLPIKKANSKPKRAVPAGAGIPNEKVFVGNLSWDIEDDTIKEFFKDCGTTTDVFWLTDKETGRFKGCGFVTFEDVDQATAACAKAGEMLMGRDISINFAKPRPGGATGGGGKKKFQDKPMSEKPAGCTTCFVGNLSFDIDDDAMHKFAEGCEVSNIRWLTDRDSGDFKGCGFIEFADTASVDEFVKKNGSDLMGRNIRIDYAKARD